MEKISSYEQLGKFIAYFQMAEKEINEIMQLLCKGIDKEVVQILTNDLEFSKRLNTADVLFSKLVGTHQFNEIAIKGNFHDLIAKLNALGARRNTLVHSNYIPCYDADGLKGLLRENSQLKGKKGFLKIDEEMLFPETLNTDIEKIEIIFDELNDFRKQIINWLYPDI